MTEKELRKKMTADGRHTSAPIQNAIVDVMVHRMKWRTAAIKHDVTESGICRCMQRLSLKSTRVDTR